MYFPFEGIAYKSIAKSNMHKELRDDAFGLPSFKSRRGYALYPLWQMGVDLVLGYVCLSYRNDNVSSVFNFSVEDKAWKRRGNAPGKWELYHKHKLCM